jgi:hypothetical protein
MKNKKIIFICIFSFWGQLLPAVEPSSTLENLLSSLPWDSTVIAASRDYETAKIEQKYRYLQWWRPSLNVFNDLIYPYKAGEFDNLAASNKTSLVFSAPLPTGTMLELSTSYGINRDMVSLEKWGFSQDLQGKIGIGQSLNPWWLHTGKNPYTEGVMLRTGLARNNYNTAVKTSLFYCIQSYIAIRKAERSRDMLKERITLYDDMLSAYQQINGNGGISWKEFQTIRKDKWEAEEEMFVVVNNINTLQVDIFKTTGIHVVNVKDEPLVAVASLKWLSPFILEQFGGIRRLEEANIQFQDNILQTERLIARQNNAPLVKFEFGTSFILPVKEAVSLGDAWKSEYFTDNILNNWALTISVDLSNIFSPLNKKNESVYRQSQFALRELLENIQINKQKEKSQNTLIINQLEDQVIRVGVILGDEEKNIQDDKAMFERGAITELEYRNSALEYKSMYMALENITDDLWLYRLVASFFP